MRTNSGPMVRASLPPSGNVLVVNVGLELAVSDVEHIFEYDVGTRIVVSDSLSEDSSGRLSSCTVIRFISLMAR